MIFLNISLVVLLVFGLVSFAAAGQQWFQAIHWKPEGKYQENENFLYAVSATVAAGVFIGVTIIVSGIMAACGG